MATSASTAGGNLARMEKLKKMWRECPWLWSMCDFWLAGSKHRTPVFKRATVKTLSQGVNNVQNWWVVFGEGNREFDPMMGTTKLQESSSVSRALGLLGYSKHGTSEILFLVLNNAGDDEQFLTVYKPPQGKRTLNHLLAAP